MVWQTQSRLSKAFAALGLLVGLTMSMVSYAQDSSSIAAQIKAVQAATLEVIRNGNPQPISWNDVEEFLRSIEGTGIDSKCHNTPKGKTITDLMTLRFRKLFLQLWNQGRILYWTPQILETLGLERQLCNSTRPCSDMRAFYLPMTDQIFIRPGLSGDEFNKALYHELFHAFQYAYRYPLDVAKLAKNVESGALVPEELRAYLDFFYEAQSNWKTMRFLPEPQWQSRFSQYKVPAEIIKTAKLWGLGLIGGIPLAIFAYGWDIWHGDQGQTSSFEGATNREKLPSGATMALCLDELVLLKEWKPHLLSNNTWDFRFHRDFGNALVRTYFGELSFLYQDNQKDLSVFAQLHQQYYETIATQKTLESDPACQALLDGISEDGKSPLVEWLTMPPEKINACSVYAKTNFAAVRDPYLPILIQNQNGMRSSFLQKKRPDETSPMSGSFGKPPNENSARLREEMRKLDENFESSSRLSLSANRQGSKLLELKTPFKSEMLSGEGSTPWLTVYPQLHVPAAPPSTLGPKASEENKQSEPTLGKREP